MNIVPVFETALIASLTTNIAQLVDPPAHLQIDALKKRRWVVVPVESGSHFTKDDARLLASAIASLGIHECFAVATERLEQVEKYLRVPTTAQGLMEFSKECGHFNFALVPLNSSFIVLCTAFDYFLIAGAPNFVESALNMSLFKARAAFIRFASNWLVDDQTTQEERSRLLNIARKYDL